MATRYRTEVTEGSAMDGWDDDTRGFPLFFRMLYSPSFNTNQPKCMLLVKVITWHSLSTFV